LEEGQRSDLDSLNTLIDSAPIAVHQENSSTTSKAASTEEIKETSHIDSEPLTWMNLKEQNKSQKIEKFLWDANISNEIGRTDNILLKVVNICSVMVS
jgi:hypothetical protein